jgi:hypothetical protein
MGQRRVGFLEHCRLLRQSEIEQFDPFYRNQDIVGFQIAMGDAFLMRGIESIQDLRRVLHGFFERQWTFERRAFDELHDQVVGADVVKLADMGMVQGRDGSGFVFEAFGELSLRNFDGDDAIKACVARSINLAHTTCAYRRKNFVRAEFVTG